MVENGENENKERGKPKGRGGRPPQAKKRSLVIGVRLSPAEHQHLQQRATETHQKLTGYIRSMALKGKVKPGLSPEKMEMIRTLAGMANNLNQLTRKCHAEGFYAGWKYVSGLGERIRSVVDKIETK